MSIFITFCIAVSVAIKLHYPNVFNKNVEFEKIPEFKSLRRTCLNRGYKRTFMLHPVFSEDTLLLHCKMMSNARTTLSDSSSDPNVDMQRQLVTHLHLSLWVSLCGRKK